MFSDLANETEGRNRGKKRKQSEPGSGAWINSFWLDTYGQGMMGLDVINFEWAAYLQSYSTGIIGVPNSSQHFPVFNKLIIAGYKYNSTM